jgi:hypothetical protein
MKCNYQTKAEPGLEAQTKRSAEKEDPVMPIRKIVT